MTDTPKSDRDIPLIVTHGAHESPIHNLLTAELYVKWYSLFFVSDGAVTPVHFHELESFAPKGESTFVDHIPNPRAIEAYAEFFDLRVDPLFLEVAHGRWLIEAGFQNES